MVKTDRNMKLRYFFTALSCAVLAVGCVEDTLSDSAKVQDSAQPSGKEGYVEISLSTKAEAGVKTSLSGKRVNWDMTDKITVFGAGTTNYEFSVLNADGTSASFVGSVLPEDAAAESYIAAYPYDEALTVSGTTLSGVEVKAQQPLVAGSFAQGVNPSLAYAAGDELIFRNLCALIRIPVIGPVKVKKIVVTAPAGAAIAGKGTVDVSSESPALSMKENQSNVITLTTEEAVDAVDGADFYAVIAPQTASASYDIEVILEDGTSQVQTLVTELTRAGLKSAEQMTAYDAPVFYGSANCYIGKAGEVIEFGVNAYYATDWGRNQGTCSPTTNPAFSGKVASADIDWKENTLTSISAAYQDGKVTVRDIAGNGNALVAIKDAAGNILWSYHIWVPVADPTETLTYPMDPEFSKNESYEVMPMALGAMNTTGADAAGLFYQWGRKDPLGRADLTSIVREADGDVSSCSFVPSSIDWANETILREEVSSKPDAIYDYTVKNPRKYIKNGYTWKGEASLYGLWGNPNRVVAVETWTKSVYDPCPAGYKVAPFDLFANFITEGGNKSDNAANGDVKYFNIANPETFATDLGYAFYYDEGKTDFYPFAGLRLNTSDNLTLGGVQGVVSVCNAGKSANNRACYLLYQCTSALAGLQSNVTLFKEDYLSRAATVRCIKE